MSKSEIRQMLGDYEWLSWNDSIKDFDINYWNYSLGIKPGAMNTKKEIMTVIFQDDKVANIETYNEEITYETKK